MSKHANSESRAPLGKVFQDEDLNVQDKVLQEVADAEIIPPPGKDLAREGATRDNPAMENCCTAFDEPKRTSSALLNKTQGLVNADEIARILNVPKTWIYERTRQGQEAIPFIRLGAYVRFEPEEVIHFFKSKES